MAAQAISMSVPRSGSMFTALLWKEWRQQRWLALPLAAAPTALYVAIFCFATVPDGKEVAVAVSLILTLLTPLIVGASVFCGERDDDTDEFLHRMPSGGLRVFTLKLLSVWAATALTILTLAAAITISNAEFRTQLAGGITNRTLRRAVRDLAVVYPVVLLTLSMTPALVSAWARRTLPNILLALVSAAAVLTAMTMSLSSVDHLDPGMDAREKTLTILVAVTLPILLVLIASPLVWIRGRGEPSVRARVKGGILLIALLVASVVAVPLYLFGRVVFLVSPEDHLSGILASPMGRYGVGESLWFRQVLVDAETGRCEWLSRFHVSWTSGGRMWSPSGKRLLWASGGLVRPYYHNSPFTKVFDENVNWWMIEVESGRCTDLEDLSPELGKLIQKEKFYPYGWLSEEMLILSSDEGKGAFFELPAGPAKHFDLPGHMYADVCSRHVTADGLVMVEHRAQSRNGTERRYFRARRFTTDHLSSEDLAVPLPALDEQTKPYPQDVSHDGRWALVAESWKRRKGDFWLIPIIAEDLAGSAPSSPASVKGVQSAGFLGKSDVALIHDEKELILLKPAAESPRRIQVVPAEAEERITVVRDSPSGRYAFARVEAAPDAEVVNDDYLVVADLDSGETHRIEITYAQRFQWLGDDWIVAANGRNSLLISRDGKEVRLLFGERGGD
jgi:hypothetical protein